MPFNSYGVTGRLITCSPFCYFLRSPILATATHKVTEVTGKSQEKIPVPLDPHAHEKNNFDSNIAVTSGTSVTYYLMNTENTDSTEVTALQSRSNFWRYPDFFLMHDPIGVFAGVFFHIWKMAFSGISRIVSVLKHRREWLQWTK